jgi:hypothetical protein
MALSTLSSLSGLRKPSRDWSWNGNDLRPLPNGELELPPKLESFKLLRRCWYERMGVRVCSFDGISAVSRLTRQLLLSMLKIWLDFGPAKIIRKMAGLRQRSITYHKLSTDSVGKGLSAVVGNCWLDVKNWVRAFTHKIFGKLKSCSRD